MNGLNQAEFDGAYGDAPVSMVGAPLLSGQKTVLVFDIRSSTVILSNLAQQGYSQLYSNFHVELKDWLKEGTST